MFSIEAFLKFEKIVKTNAFIEYEKEYSAKITEALSKGYNQKKDEPKLVEQLEKIVNSVTNFNKQGNNPNF